MMRIAVVGSGPASLAAVNELIVLGYRDITVVTNNDNTEYYENSKIQIKRNSNISSPYDLNSYTSYKFGSGVFEGLVPSKNLGGFSNVWGASLDYKDDGSLLSADGAEDWILIGDTLKGTYLKDGISIFPSKLAINKQLCNHCGECIAGCKFDAIWSASYKFEELRKNGQIRVIYDIVESFSSEFSPVLKLRSGVEIPFDHLFIGAGIIGSLLILGKSDKELQTFEISDSRTIFIFGFKLKTETIKKWLSLNHFSVKRSDKYKYFLQVYPNVSYLKSRALSIKGDFLQNIVSRAWNRMHKHIAAGILYFDESNSDKISFNYNIEKNQLNISAIPNATKKKAYISATISLLRYQFNIGVLFVPFIKQDLGAGAGFHSWDMKVLDQSNKRIQVSEYLSTKWPNITMVGAATIKSVPPGPITSELMRDSRTSVQKFHARNLE